MKVTITMEGEFRMNPVENPNVDVGLEIEDGLPMGETPLTKEAFFVMAGTLEMVKGRLRALVVEGDQAKEIEH